MNRTSVKSFLVDLSKTAGLAALRAWTVWCL